MKRTAFVCVGARRRGDELHYHELPAKEGGEEFFAFFDGGGERERTLLKELFREAIAAPRLGHPLKYFLGFIERLNAIAGGIDRVEELIGSAIIVIAIRRRREVHLFHNAGIEAVHWDGAAGAETSLDAITGYADIPLRSGEGQGDLFTRFSEDLFVLRRFTLGEGSHTILLAPSREFVTRNFEALRNSVFFPSFALRPGSEVTIETDRSVPAIHWDAREETAARPGNRRGGTLSRKVSIPFAAGTLTALLALIIFFGPWARERPHPAGSDSSVLLSTGEEIRPEPGEAETGTVAPIPEQPPRDEPSDATRPRPIAFSTAWRRQFSSPVTSSPQWYRGIIYFGCRDAHLYAYTPDGAMKWKYDAAQGIGATPCCVSRYVIGADYGGTIFCLDAETGALQWTHETGERIVSSPQARDDLVVVGTMGGTILALKLADGTSAWSRKLGRAIWANPAIGTEYIIVATTDGLLARLDTGGTVVWRASPGGSIRSSPLCIEKEDLVVFGAGDTYIYGYSLSEGKLLWRAATGGEANGPPVTDGERILAGSDDGYLNALSLAGTVLWKRDLGGAVKSKPLIVGSNAFITSYGSKIYAISLTSGDIVAEYGTDDPVYSSPAHDGQKVYFGSNGGSFQALWIYGGAG